MQTRSLSQVAQYNSEIPYPKYSFQVSNWSTSGLMVSSSAVTASMLPNPDTLPLNWDLA